MPAPVPTPDSLPAHRGPGIGAWHPFTGKGVAAFAGAGRLRIFVIQILAAAAVAGLLVWALHQTWFPVMHNALPHLPEAASIVSGSLSWPDEQSVRLAQNPWLDVVVSPGPNHTDPTLGQTADLQLELLRNHFRIHGPLGHLSQPYPESFQFDLGRIPAVAAWDAWRRPASVLIACGVSLGLLGSWWCLASLFCLPAWILARSLGREVHIGSVWKMAAAALIVGTLIAATGLAAYAIGVIRLPGLLLSQALHLPFGCIWLFWGILSLPPGTRPRKADPNPFRASGRRP